MADKQRILKRFGSFTLVVDIPPIPLKRLGLLPSPQDMSEIALSHFSSLPERWQRIITMRRQGMTLEAIGAKLGISRQRVKQLQDKAVRRSETKNV